MALIERYQKTTDIGFWEGQIPMSYIYTVGKAVPGAHKRKDLRR